MNPSPRILASMLVAVSASTTIAPESTPTISAPVVESSPVPSTAAEHIAAVNAGWTPRSTVIPATLTSSLADHPLAEAAPDIEVPFEGANGWALRLYDIDGGPTPGHIYTLAGGAVTSPGALKVWSDTPRIPGTPRAGEDALLGHLAAHEAAEAILDRSIDLVDFTIAGGDGPSAGLGQWIAYMDLATDGGFTMGIPTAATGAIEPRGQLSTVTSVTVKVEAALVAGVDVVFATSYNGDRAVLARRGPGAFETTGLASVRRWGDLTAIATDHHASDAPAFGVVQVGHVGDIAAWYCGAGSDVACDVAVTLDTWGQTEVAFDADAAVTAAGPTSSR